MKEPRISEMEKSNVLYILPLMMGHPFTIDTFKIVYGGKHESFYGKKVHHKTMERLWKWVLWYYHDWEMKERIEKIEKIKSRI